MDARALESAISDVVGHVTATSNKTLPSAVTTAWGVAWDETYIARDLMQNFFDANRNHLEQVRVEVTGATVVVRAPAAFNLERLFYLGSEKGVDDVGQYGEGFKVAAACLLRDHDVVPIVVSWTDAVAIRIADDAVQGTALRPVVYDFFTLDEGVPGTVLILHGCAPKLRKAMSQGLTHFFHEQNPLLGARRWQSWDKKFAIYASADTRGHIFYRHLKRAEIDDIPIVLVLDKPYAAIEKKIKSDRDRNAFGDEIRKIFYHEFVRGGVRDAESAQRVIVEAAKQTWLRGHPLLSEIAENGFSYHNPAWNPATSAAVFGDAYFARCASTTASEQLEFDRLEGVWRDDGRKALPQYFSKFRVLNAKSHLEERLKRAMDEARSRDSRPVSVAEKRCLDVLAMVMRELAPEITNVFKKRRVTYTVAETEAVLGELIAGRSQYHSVEVYFASQVFEADFAEALAVYLHEHAHIFGRDGDRQFGDALTALIEALVRHRVQVDAHEAVWRTASSSVVAERQQDHRREGDEVEAWLRTVPTDRLREIALQMPRAVWRGVVERVPGAHAVAKPAASEITDL